MGDGFGSRGLLGRLLFDGLLAALAGRGHDDGGAYLTELQNFQHMLALDRFELEQGLGYLVEGRPLSATMAFARTYCPVTILWISSSILCAVSSETFSVRVISRPRNTVS